MKAVNNNSVALRSFVELKDAINDACASLKHSPKGAVRVYEVMICGIALELRLSENNIFLLATIGPIRALGRDALLNAIQFDFCSLREKSGGFAFDSQRGNLLLMRTAEGLSPSLVFKELDCVVDLALRCIGHLRKSSFKFADYKSLR